MRACVHIPSTYHNKYIYLIWYVNGLLCITLKLCGANEAQRNLRPNERLVMRFLAHGLSLALFHVIVLLYLLIFDADHF